MIVHAVADRLIARLAGAVTPLALQKLLYYAQGWHLAAHDEPLFDEEIQAWKYGPVVPLVYRRFRQLGDGRIPRAAIMTNPDGILARPVLELLDWIGDRYGTLSAIELMRRTHNEAPWREIWGDRPADDEGRDVIPLDRLRAFFKTEQTRLAEMADLAPVPVTPDLVSWAGEVIASQ